MFGKYNINELYLASINVSYTEKEIFESRTFHECGFYLAKFGKNGIDGYKYITLVKKCKDKYIDLENPKRKIVLDIIPNETSYVIECIEPINKYYLKDATYKEKLGKSQSLKLARKYYGQYSEKQMNYVGINTRNK